MSRRRRRRPAGLLLVLLLAAGCGGSGRLSHAALLEHADRLCRDADVRLARLGQPADTAGVVRLGPQVIALQQRFVDGFSRLRPGRADQAQVDRLLASYRRTARLTRQLVAAARAGRRERLVGLAAQLRLENAHGDRLARALGLGDCPTR